MANKDALALQRRDENWERIKGIGINLYDLVWTPGLTNPPTAPSTSTIAFNSSYHGAYLRDAGVKFIRLLLDPTHFWAANTTSYPYPDSANILALAKQWVQACVNANLPVIVGFRDPQATVAQPSMPTAPFNMALAVSDEFVGTFGAFLQTFCADMAAISPTLVMINPSQEVSFNQYTQQGTVCGQVHTVNPTQNSGTLTIKLTGLSPLDISLSSGRTPTQIISDITAAIAASGTYAGKVNATLMWNRLLITGTNVTNRLESVTVSSTGLGVDLGIKTSNGKYAITQTQGYGSDPAQRASVMRWNAVQKRLFAYMRAGAPYNTFIARGYDFGTIEGSLRTGLPSTGDPNTIYDIAHLYEPIITQQGQTGSNQYLYGGVYPITAATIQSTTDTITRSSAGQVDPIDPAKTPLYSPGASTVSISGYTYTTDYTVSNNAVTWVSGHGPSAGATYTLNFKYYNNTWLNSVESKPPVKVVDTGFVRATGTNDDVINAAYGTLYVDTYNGAPNGIKSLVQGATTYVEGTDWTVSGSTITWIGNKPADGTTYTATFFCTRSKANAIYQLNNAATVTFTPSIASIASALTIAQNYAVTGYGSANITARIKLIADIAKRNNVKVLIGEFGMTKQADNSLAVRTFCDQASNTAYYQDFVAACNTYGVPACFWELRSGAWGAFSLKGNDNGSTVSGFPNGDLRQTWVATALGFTGTNPNP